MLDLRSASKNDCGNEHRQHRQHDGDDRARQQRRLADAEIVDRGERHDGADRQRARQLGRGVVTEGQCHRGAARELADDKAPSGDKAPEGAQALAPVDIGAARFGIEARQLGRRGGVAVGDKRGDQEANQQSGAGSTCSAIGRASCRERVLLGV